MTTSHDTRTARFVRRAVVGLMAAGALFVAGAAGTAAVQDGGGGGKAALDDMDLALLQTNLLKIYVVERESAINDVRLQELKVSSEGAGHLGRETLTKPTQEQMEDLKKRHTHIHHYLTMERTNAIQVINVIDKVLGQAPDPEDADARLRQIHQKRLPLVNFPRGTYLRDAIRKMGEMLGVPTEAELPPLNKYTLFLVQEETTGEAALKAMCGIHGLEYRYEGGALVFRHPDFIGEDDLDDEDF